MAQKASQPDGANATHGSLGRGDEFRVAFKIPDAVVEAIQTEFGFALTAAEVARLEAMAGEAIGFRRSFPEGLATCEERRRQCAKTKKRREQIVKAVNKLSELLDEDERAPKVWRLNVGTFGIDRNALAQSLSVRDDAAPTLAFVKELAQQPHPLGMPLSGKVSKLGRPKSADSEAFEVLMRTGIEIFRERGVPPTANHDKNRRGYNSPLLRGLKKLHDALPLDVQAKSFCSLGSPLAEWIKKYNRQEPRVGEVSRVPIRNRGKRRRAA